MAMANINYGQSVQRQADKARAGEEKGENSGDGNASFPRDKLDPVLVGANIINVITRARVGERRGSVSLFSI